MYNKYPNMFLYALVIYMFILGWGIFNFIVPVIYYGVFFEYIEFSLPLTAMILLPLILFLLYLFDGRFLFIKRHENAVRTIIILSIIISFVLVLLFAALV